jgi:molybdopterin-binding protein
MTGGWADGRMDGEILHARGIEQSYSGRIALKLDEFSVGRGAKIALVGPNGSGKSTLLRIMACLERPQAGEVVLDGRRVAGRGVAAGITRAARRRITLVEQRPILLQGTVAENLEFGLRARGTPAAERRRLANHALDRFALGPLAGRGPGRLSDGEVQRVAVARALLLGADVLLLDEPLSSADRAATTQLYHAMEEERRTRGITVLLASHQLEEAYRWADDLRALADGRLSAVTPENLFRVDVPAGGEVREVRVGSATIAVMTDRTGPVILAVPTTDIFVSREPMPSSARNMLPGRVVRIADHKGGGVHLTADVGVELTALITHAAAQEMQLLPGAPVVMSFKASAVRVF